MNLPARSVLQNIASKSPGSGPIVRDRGREYSGSFGTFFEANILAESRGQWPKSVQVDINNALRVALGYRIEDRISIKRSP
jgi:hypothetical protein